MIMIVGMILGAALMYGYFKYKGKNNSQWN